MRGGLSGRIGDSLHRVQGIGRLHPPARLAPRIQVAGGSRREDAALLEEIRPAQARERLHGSLPLPRLALSARTESLPRRSREEHREDLAPPGGKAEEDGGVESRAGLAAL